MLQPLSYPTHFKFTQQRKSKSFPLLKTTIAIASLAIGCLIPIGFIQSQKAELRQKAAEVNQQLQTDPVTGLVLAIQAIGQNRNRLSWDILPEVQASLLEAVQTARERDRFEQPGQIYSVQFTPDAQRIAAAGESGSIYLWDRQGHQTQILQGDGQAIGSLDFSPDGAAVFANPVAENGMVQFWNLKDSSSYLPPKQQSQLISAAFSSDGQLVVSGSGRGQMQLWNLQGEWIANLYPRQSGSITAVASDGWNMVSGGADGNINLWNNKGDWQGRLWAGARVTSLNLSQGGQRIISQDLNRHQAFIWDNQVNQWHQFLLGETATARSATLSPDNRLIARGNHDGTVQLLPLQAQVQRFLPRSLSGHEGAVNTVSFSADGQTIATGSDDGTVRLWDVWDGTMLTKYHLQEWSQDTLSTFILNPTGTEIAVIDTQGKTHFRDIEQRSLARISDALSQPSARLFFSPNGQAIAIEEMNASTGRPNGTVSLWNANGEAIGRLTISSEEPVQTIALSNDGQRLVSLSKTGTLQLWSAAGQPLGQAITADPTLDPTIQYLGFSPNGQQVISGSLGDSELDGRTCLWTIESNSMHLSTCHSIASQTAAFHPDGTTIAIGSNDGKLYQWHLQTGQVELSSQSHTAPILAIAFNTKGTAMASGSADGIIRLSNTQGNPIGQPFVGHQTAIQSLAFRENDETVVSLGKNGEVRVWQAGWQGWLTTACNRLQDHPVLQSPASSAAERARAICQQQVWSDANQKSAQTVEAAAELPPTTNSVAQETQVVIKLGDRRVYVYQGDQVQASYPIAVGKAGWETPTGSFRVFEMLQNPAWTHPITRERMQPGSDNPLGSRWIGFWTDKYNKIGFHGTPDRDSVGQAVSHGCIRMYDEDVRALYEQVKLGTIVTVEP
ncbi:MAG: hypothetical protein Kow00121_03920 [Elainellaceae cyanobacterium]